MSVGRRLTFALIYFACLALVFLVGAEFISRVLFPPQDLEISKSNDQLEYDPLLGWRARRGFKGKVEHYPYPLRVDVRINADGFRDGDWDEKIARANNT